MFRQVCESALQFCKSWKVDIGKWSLNNFASDIRHLKKKNIFNILISCWTVVWMSQQKHWSGCGCWNLKVTNRRNGRHQPMSVPFPPEKSQKSTLANERVEQFRARGGAAGRARHGPELTGPYSCTQSRNVLSYEDVFCSWKLFRALVSHARTCFSFKTN